MYRLFQFTSGLAYCIPVLVSVLLCSSKVIGQETVELRNPSFEGIVKQGNIYFNLDGWIDCGQFKSQRRTAPDIHPGNFWGNKKTQAGIDMPPSEGRTYLGMVARDDNTYESVSQQLDDWLKEDQCYLFSVDMLRSLDYWSGLPGQDITDRSVFNFNKPVVLRVWGSNSVCFHDPRYGVPELLVESQPVKNIKEWQTNIFMIQPKSDYKFITLEVFYVTPTDAAYGGHILLDNASHFIPIDCDDDEQVMEFYEEREDINRVNKAKIQKKQAELIAEQKKQEPKKEKEDKPEENNSKVEEGSLATNVPEKTIAKKEEIAKESRTKSNRPEPKKTIKKEPKILKKLNKKSLAVGQTVKIEKLYFEQDTTLFTGDSDQVLEELADFLKDNKSVKIEIGGHTNGIPDHDYCDALSEARAQTVANYLIEKGVDPNSLVAKGYGKRKPLATNKTVAGRTLNQRVEITILQL